MVTSRNVPAFGFVNTEHLIIECPRSLVGRLIGKSGTTAKGIQLFTETLINVYQAADPALVYIVGCPESMQMAASIVTDIIVNSFKGFALLRELVSQQHKIGSSKELREQLVYAPGFGLFPRRQVRRFWLSVRYAHAHYSAHSQDLGRLHSHKCTLLSHVSFFSRQKLFISDMVAGNNSSCRDVSQPDKLKCIVAHADLLMPLHAFCSGSEQPRTNAVSFFEAPESCSEAFLGQEIVVGDAARALLSFLKLCY